MPLYLRDDGVGQGGGSWVEVDKAGRELNAKAVGRVAAGRDVCSLYVCDWG